VRPIMVQGGRAGKAACRSGSALSEGLGNTLHRSLNRDEPLGQLPAARTGAERPKAGSAGQAAGLVGLTVDLAGTEDLPVAEFVARV
jgi:hypothetical protein